MQVQTMSRGEELKSPLAAPTGTKRKVDEAKLSDDQRFTKRFNQLNLGTSKSFIVVTESLLPLSSTCRHRRGGGRGSHVTQPQQGPTHTVVATTTTSRNRPLSTISRLPAA